MSLPYAISLPSAFPKQTANNMFAICQQTAKTWQMAKILIPVVLEAPLGDPPAPVESLDVVNAWQARSDDYSIVQCAMLYGLEPGLQRHFERHGAYDMFQELKFIFEKNARIERYDISDNFYAC